MRPFLFPPIWTDTPKRPQWRFHNISFVSVEPPIGSGVVSTMNEIRSWLDRRRVQPVYFLPVSQDGIISFQIGFRTEDEAELFRQEFGGVVMPTP